MHVRSFAANFICAFIPLESWRGRVRAAIKFGRRRFIRFAVADAGREKPHVRTYFGHACKNMVVVIDNEIAYKFPLAPKKYHDAVREKTFIDAFRKFSPVPLGAPDVLNYRGTDVLKYQFIPGKIITDIAPEQVKPHAAKIGRQIGEFMFEIGRSNPRSLAQTRPAGAHAPGFMYGWCHSDIGANFIIDPRTMDVVGFIDWATARYGEFGDEVARAFKHLDKRGYGAVMFHAVMRYGELYSRQK